MHSSLHVAKKILNLAENAGDKSITPMKLLKLVYIAHGWMLGLCGRRLITEDVYAWQYGPVIPKLYKDIKRFGRTQVTSTSIDGDSLPEFDGEEESIISQVYEKYSQYSGPTLSAMTHAKGTPWWEVWHKNKQIGGVIPTDLIRTYYKELSVV